MSGSGNGSGSGPGRDDLPPPPQVNLVDILANQNRLLEALERSVANRGGGGNPRDADISDFLRVNPPIFTKSKNPLDADNWLRTIEQKSALVRCNDQDKVLFASHQLQEAAEHWWQGFLQMQPAGHVTTWVEFCKAFRAFHIPKGLMDLKRREFLDLKQGCRPVLEYVHAFNELALYAPEEIASDDRKCDRFMNGLSEELQDKLSTAKYADFSDLMNLAIVAEEKMNKLEEKKRKRVVPASLGGGMGRPRYVPPPAYRGRAPRPMWVSQRPAAPPPPPRAVTGQSGSSGGFPPGSCFR
ncbi:hypothetical protein ACP4OV_018026 [Aristida adscensionis]